MSEQDINQQPAPIPISTNDVFRPDFQSKLDPAFQSQTKGKITKGPLDFQQGFRSSLKCWSAAY